MQSKSYPTRQLKADTITVTVTVTDIYCVNITKKQFYWRAVQQSFSLANQDLERAVQCFWYHCVVIKCFNCTLRKARNLKVINNETTRRMATQNKLRLNLSAVFFPKINFRFKIHKNSFNKMRNKSPQTLFFQRNPRQF